MSCAGPLSAVMTIAGAGMLPGAASVAGVGSSFGVSTALTGTLGSFDALPVTQQFSSVVTAATGQLSPGTLSSLRTLASSSFPALTNAIPSSFVADLAPIAAGGVADGGFTGLIGQTASGIMGDGDLSRFAQTFNAGQGYLGQANQYLNSALNVEGLATTFGVQTGGMDSLITGSFSQVTEAFGSFGEDLGNLGNLVDLGNLPNLGNPAALVQQLGTVGGITPGVESALRSAGLDTGALLDLTGTGSLSALPPSANKLLYEGMTQITGSELDQVKAVLGVRTPSINNMAELLNPVKILPNSFPALTMPTPDGLRGIYADTSGTVNTNIEKFLVDPNAPEYTGDDPIVLARLARAGSVKRATI